MFLVFDLLDLFMRSTLCNLGDHIEFKPFSGFRAKAREEERGVIGATFISNCVVRLTQ